MRRPDWPLRKRSNPRQASGRRAHVARPRLATDGSGADAILHQRGGARRVALVDVLIPKDDVGWGAAWKRAVPHHYNHTLSIVNQGSVMAYRHNYLDLEPTYRNAFGQPLLPMTFDFYPNE